jgi:hypothetical protein
MQALELTNYRGLELLDVLQSFETSFRNDIWLALCKHPIYKSIEDNGLVYAVVDGKWLRKFIGHVAVDGDYLSEYRRHYPPITDKDLILIRNYS